MPEYTITVHTPDGDEHRFACGDEEYVLEAAEAAGIELPFSCRAGVCTTCTCRLETGELDQSEASALDDDQMEEGFVLICVGRPKADTILLSHQRDALDE